MSGIKIGVGFGAWPSGLPNPAAIGAYAERAEDLGIDSIWLSDRIVSPQPHLDIACAMALFAARTRRIKMGPSVLTLPARDPVQVARTYATLDYLTGGCGRVIMAVGLGSDPGECAACGIPPAQRAGRLEEGVEVLRKLWAGTEVTHDGRFYKFSNVTIEPRPAHGPLDIWIGGRSDAALRRVARYGDGWFPSFITPAEFAAGMRTLAGYGAQQGRAIDAREAGVVLLTSLTSDRSRADAVLQALAGRAKLAPEALAARAAVGSPEACLERLQAYVAAGCTKYVLFPIVPADELLPQIELFATRIIPRFN